MRTYGILCCTGRIHKNVWLLVKNTLLYKGATNFSEWNITDLGMPKVTTVTLVLLFFEELILGMFLSQLQPILLTICGVASLYLCTDM